MTTMNLHFKFTISRGRDTYGYNICTLLVDGQILGRCIGGGYDMQGTAFAQWLESGFQPELKLMCRENGIGEQLPQRNYTKGGVIVRVYDLPGYYGLTVHTPDKGTEMVHLDGGCGFDSMKRIAEAIGIKLQWNKESARYKNHTFYTAIFA